jgi:hypothetical protein
MFSPTQAILRVRTGENLNFKTVDHRSKQKKSRVEFENLKN